MKLSIVVTALSLFHLVGTAAWSAGTSAATMRSAPAAAAPAAATNANTAGTPATVIAPAGAPVFVVGAGVTDANGVATAVPGSIAGVVGTVQNPTTVPPVTPPQRVGRTPSNFGPVFATDIYGNPMPNYGIGTLATNTASSFTGIPVANFVGTPARTVPGIPLQQTPVAHTTSGTSGASGTTAGTTSVPPAFTVTIPATQ